MDGPGGHIEEFVDDFHGGVELIGGGGEETVHAVLDDVRLLMEHVNVVVFGHVMKDLCILGLGHDSMGHFLETLHQFELAIMR